MTFINSSALLVSLMALQLTHIDQKTCSVPCCYRGMEWQNIDTSPGYRVSSLLIIHCKLYLTRIGGIHRVGYISFVYNCAPVPWIITVNNFSFLLISRNYVTYKYVLYIILTCHGCVCESDWSIAVVKPSKTSRPVFHM